MRVPTDKEIEEAKEYLRQRLDAELSMRKMCIRDRCPLGLHVRRLTLHFCFVSLVILP